MKDLTIVIPVKGEDERFVQEIEDKATCEVIVIRNLPYGKAIKTGVRRAGTKFILTMDGDGQHTWQEANKLYKVFKLLKCDLLIGDRREKIKNPVRASASNLINFLAGLFAYRWVVDLNSGMRIFSRENAISYEPILCNDFSYTSSLAMSHLADGLSVEWFPINVFPRVSGKSHVQPIKHGFITLYYIIRIGGALRTRGLRKWLRSRWLYRIIKKHVLML